MNIEPRISVVIPVHNGAPWLDACLKGIMGQTLFHETEIIAIDSGSTDSSVAILGNYPVRVFSIAAADFNHGLTRQYGVELSRGEYVAMTVQDARPFDENWLQHLLDGFGVAENVAGVCGQQVVPHDRDKNPLEWFRPVDKHSSMRVYSYKSPAEFEALTPIQKMWACGWDDVTAMYKKDVMCQLPFRKVNFGEDAIWAKDALLQGYSLVYNQAARVYHHHFEDFDYAFRRNLAVMYLRYKQFGCIYNRPAQNWRDVLRSIKTIALSAPLTLKEKWDWFNYSQDQFKGRLKAYEVFASALAKGETALDVAYDQYCGKPPVHQKKEHTHQNTVAA